MYLWEWMGWKKGEKQNRELGLSFVLFQDKSTESQIWTPEVNKVP